MLAAPFARVSSPQMSGDGYVSFHAVQITDDSAPGDAGPWEEARVRTVCRPTLDALVVTALQRALPPDFSPSDLVRIMSAYVPDTDADAWAPIELRNSDGGGGTKDNIGGGGGGADNTDGDPRVPSVVTPPRTKPVFATDVVRVDWRMFRELHGHRKLAALRLDPDRGHIVYRYQEPVATSTLWFVIEYLGLRVTFSRTRPPYEGEWQPPSLPRHYHGTHIRECAQLTDAERHWATLLWPKGPAAMLDLIAFLERECPNYREPPLSRVTEIAELALAVITPNTACGPCRTVDAALAQRHHTSHCRRCLRATHVCLWMLVALSLASLIGLSARLFFYGDGAVIDGRREDGHALERSVASSLVFLALLSLVAALTWFSGAAIRGAVFRCAGERWPPTCLGVVALAALIVTLLTGRFSTGGSLAIAAKIVACMLLLAACGVCTLTCCLANQSTRKGGFRTAYTRFRPVPSCLCDCDSDSF
jgi:hypothetical protein